MTSTSSKKKTTAKAAPVEKASAPKLVIDNSASVEEVVKESSTGEAIAKKTLEKEPSINDKVKETVKRTVRKRTTTDSKKPSKTTSTKTSTSSKEANVKTSLVLQYQSIEVSSEAIVEKVKDMWVNSHNKTENEIKNIDIYVKPEEYSAYYVINDRIKGRIDL